MVQNFKCSSFFVSPAPPFFKNKPIRNGQASHWFSNYKFSYLRIQLYCKSDVCLLNKVFSGIPPGIHVQTLERNAPCTFGLVNAAVYVAACVLMLFLFCLLQRRIYFADARVFTTSFDVVFVSMLLSPFCFLVPCMLQAAALIYSHSTYT